MVMSKDIYWEYEVNGSGLPFGWNWVEADEIADLISRGIAPQYDDLSDQVVLRQTCVRKTLSLPKTDAVTN